MGKLYKSTIPRLILPSDLVADIVQQPELEFTISDLDTHKKPESSPFVNWAHDISVEVEKVNTPIIQEKIVYVDRPVEVIVEVPVVEKQTEYITITKIETVEVPVIKEVERIVTVHDIEATLQEKKRVVALEQKVSRYQIVVAALIVLTVILGAV